MSFSNKQISIFKPIIATLLLLVFLALPVYGIQAQSLMDKIGTNLGLLNIEARLPSSGVGNFPVLVGVIIKAALLFVGTIFLVVVIYGGFTWMTAGGSTEKVQKAGSLIRNGVIGILIIFVSYALTLFIFDVLLQASLTP
jgi:magnesium-transporting ATPase (P-type)